MSLNKIIIGFIVILLVFSAFIVFQINRTPTPPAKITINNHTFSVETATTSAQQEQGLSGKSSLPQDQGMLFIFKTANRYPFWMKEMKFPLDIIFIKNNKIVHIFQNVPVPTTTDESKLPIYTPPVAANEVLEINAGLAKTFQFKNGDPVTVTLK